MRYRVAGNSGVSVSAIGFGCGGNAGLMVRGSFEEQRTVIARALELGITYFDNAPDYGDGVGETNLGRVLKDLGARPLITSKVEVRRENLSDIAGHVVRSTEESLSRLGVDHLDFLQIHNGPAAEPPDIQGRVYTQVWIEDYLRPGGALEGLEQLLQAGKARAIGFICRGNDAAPVQQLLDTGKFSMINVSYHLLNPTAGTPRPAAMPVLDWGQVIDAAQAKGVGVAIYSPLASGALTDVAVSGGAPHPLSMAAQAPRQGGDAAAQAAKALSFLSIPGKRSLAQAAFQFILTHPGVTTVLGGFSALAHLEELAPAADAGPLDQADLARIQEAWNANFAL